MNGEALAKIQSGIQPNVCQHGLLQGEALVLWRLQQAWDAWCALQGHDGPGEDFRDAIHRCQYVIALRVAIRANPDVWRDGP